jgi:hypothetical protein
VSPVISASVPQRLPEESCLGLKRRLTSGNQLLDHFSVDVR